MADRASLRAALVADFRKPAKPLTIEGASVQFFARQLTLNDVDAEANAPDEPIRIKMAKTLARVLSDENGDYIYDVKNPDDIAELLALPVELTNRLLAECQRVNSTNVEGVEQVGKTSPPETN